MKGRHVDQNFTDDLDYEQLKKFVGVGLFEVVKIDSIVGGINHMIEEYRLMMISLATLFIIYTLVKAFSVGKKFNKNLKIRHLRESLNSQTQRAENMNTEKTRYRNKLRLVNKIGNYITGSHVIFFSCTGLDFYFEIAGCMLKELVQRKEFLKIYLPFVVFVILGLMGIKRYFIRKLAEVSELLKLTSLHNETLLHNLVNEFGDKFKERLVEYVNHAMGENIENLTKEIVVKKMEFDHQKDKNMKISKIEEFYHVSVNKMLSFGWSIKPDKLNRKDTSPPRSRGHSKTGSINGNQLLNSSRSQKKFIRSDSYSSLHSNGKTLSTNHDVIEFLNGDSIIDANSKERVEGDIIINRAYIKELKRYFILSEEIGVTAKNCPELGAEISEDEEEEDKVDGKGNGFLERSSQDSEEERRKFMLKDAIVTSLQ